MTTFPSRSDDCDGDDSLETVVRDRFPQESGAPHHLQTRVPVFHQGAIVEQVFLLLDGSFVLERVDEEGRMAMYGPMCAGTLLGWQDLLDGGVHRNSGRPLTCCTVIAVACERFETALREDDRLSRTLLRQSARRAKLYEEQIFRLSTLDVPDRLHLKLYELAGSPVSDASIEVNTPLMKRELAALVGATPETLSRTLSRLKKRKVAECVGKSTFRLVPPKT